MLDLGVHDQTNINFLIEIEPRSFFPALVVVASLGHIDVLEIMLKNPSLDLDMVDPKHGCNAFWYASFYGKTHVMRILAEAGIDVLCKDKLTHANALHVSI